MKYESKMVKNKIVITTDGTKTHYVARQDMRKEDEGK